MSITCQDQFLLKFFFWIKTFVI